MPQRQDCASLLLANLDRIDRVIASICRRNGLRGDDADDFASWAKMKLVDDDYAVFRKFRGESAIGTYLTVVLSMLYREYRVSMWGRWRPSAAARRGGAIAIRLETLVYRDGHTLDQAGEILRGSGETEISDRELGELLSGLPQRGPVKPVQVQAEALSGVAAAEGADSRIVADELSATRQQASDALRTAVDQLDPEDSLILRMKFWEDMTVADVARALGLPQKPLYRRIDAALRTLREKLEALGISTGVVAELLDAPGDISGAGPSIG